MKNRRFICLLFTLSIASAGHSQDVPPLSPVAPQRDEFGNPLLPRSTREREICATMVIESVLASTAWSQLIITKLTVPRLKREYFFEAKDPQNNLFSGWITLTTRELKQQDQKSGRILSDHFSCSIPSGEYHQGEDVFVLRNHLREVIHEVTGSHRLHDNE